MKILTGNPGKRPLNTREPDPPRDTPRCPAWLSAEAKSAWKRIVPLIRRMGILTIVDVDALVAYCQTYARWKKAEEFLDKHGEVYPLKDEKGQIRCMQQFPQVSIARNQLQILRAYQQEFGLTPSARTRVAMINLHEPDYEYEDGYESDAEFKERGRLAKLNTPPGPIGPAVH